MIYSLWSKNIHEKDESVVFLFLFLPRLVTALLPAALGGSVATGIDAAGGDSGDQTGSILHTPFACAQLDEST